MRETIIDTGPLVAYLDRSDRHHGWAKEIFMRITRPLLTCEAVIAEGIFLLGRGRMDPDGLLDLIGRGLVVPEFRLMEETESVGKLMKTYRNIPMSLADACLVRMAEIYDHSEIMTLDSDFAIYRKSRRKVIPLLQPDR